MSAATSSRGEPKVSPNFKVQTHPPLPPEVENMPSTERDRWVIRHTPVLNSKYLDVWKRLKLKVRTKMMLGSLNREIQLFGTNIRKGDDLDDLLSQQIETLVRRKETNVKQTDEEPESEKLPPLLLHPRSCARMFWNILVIILLVYTATVMPFRLAFLENGVDSVGWMSFEWTLDGLFMIDVIVTCFSSYYNDEGRLVTSHREILLGYARSWMFLDIAGCMPLDVMLTEDSSFGKKYNNLLRLVRLPRLYRLTRIARLLKMCKSGPGSELIERIQDFLSLKHTAVRLLSFFSSVVHLCAPNVLHVVLRRQGGRLHP